MEIILTHQNADFDAVASMLGAYKLNPKAVPILPPRQLASVREFLTLYRNGLPFVAWEDFKASEPITHITLTDTYTRLELPDVPPDVPTLIIEHHTLERKLKPYETWAGEDVGAATTLLVERLRERKITLTSLEATLMALGIYADTGSFTYGGTTPRDIEAAAWLLAQGAVLDTMRRFLSNSLNPEQQTLLEALLQKTENRNVQGYNVTVCTAQSDSFVEGINSVTDHLREILDADAIFVIVQLPNNIQLVCRSTTDAIDSSFVAQNFGGGGHPRAAAAAIYKHSVASIAAEIWVILQEHVHPAVRIADLMSYSVQTLEADARIVDVIQRIRRIGHEGYPVVEHGQIVGLLTLRDADKTLEHGLKEATVREVMLGGSVTLKPDDPVSRLEETMVETDWGQIPIVDEHHRLLGIVTRTDLIKHWGKTHPASTPQIPHIEVGRVKQVVGQENLSLIERIARHAQEKGILMYMVGGVVRDLLLERSNTDIDFVVEGNAIEFAEHIRAEFGGRLHTYKPFGTAKWLIDDDVAQKLGLPATAIPDHIDFASTRSELYEHPTALPTVYNSSIKLDLRRRDFTINTLAVQLSPKRTMWRILDFYGGLADLEQRLIRVLHSLSFVDDPTRILRAVRFSERLQFVIEPRTAELIQTALPMLRRITGERIRNEIELLLKEPAPTRGLLKLEALGALSHIHPDFTAKPELRKAFDTLENGHPQWSDNSILLRWHLLMAQIDAGKIVSVATRLLISQNHAEDFVQTGQIAQKPVQLIQPLTKPSEIDTLLAPLSEEGLVASWILLDDATARQRIEQYHDVWRHIKPTITGHDLRERGLNPGREFGIILERLREGWLNGDIRNTDEEQLALKRLIVEVYHP